MNVVYGANESGKTLLIDAVLKILLSDTITDFDEIDRVQETPEGFVVMERGVDEIKLSREETLSDYLTVDSRDLRNIFVIRNSDLTILDQGGYFRSFTDRMIGLQTKRITQILESLQASGWLTRKDSKASLSSSKKSDYMGERRDRSKKLIKDVEGYLEKVETEKLDEVEYLAIKSKASVQELKHSIEEMEKSRNKQRYTEASNALQEIEKNTEEIRKLERFEESTLEEVKRQQQEVDGLERDIKELQGSYSQDKALLQSEQKGLGELTAKLEPLKSRVTESNSLEAKISIVQENLKNKAKTIEAASLYWRMFLALFMPSILSFIMVAALFPLQTLFLTFPFALLMVAFIFIALHLRAKGISHELEAEVKALLGEAAKSGIASSDLRSVLDAIAKLQDRQSELVKLVEGKSADVHRLEGSVGSTEATIKEKTIRAEKLKSDKADVSKRLHVDSIEDFSEKVETKKQLLIDVKEQVARLKGMFNVAPENEGDIEFWKKELQKLESYKDIEIKVSFDETIYESMKKKLEEEELKLKELETKLEEFRSKLRDFQEEAIRTRPLNRYGEEVNIDISTTSDVNELIKVLRSFIEFIDRRFNAALEAVKLFEQLASREETKVVTLFEEDKRAIELFSKFTAGRYTDLRYNPDTKTVEVALEGGKWLDASKLSKGAKDQLYMAVRIALAERLLPDEPAFFILDDPFLTSDTARLKKEMGSLKDLCNRGWSAIYFTVKDEVDNLAKEMEIPITRLRPL
jgi:DNA repair exonuclease SbcCD ATPase subunit